MHTLPKATKFNQEKLRMEIDDVKKVEDEIVEDFRRTMDILVQISSTIDETIKIHKSCEIIRVKVPAKGHE